MVPEGCADPFQRRIRHRGLGLVPVGPHETHAGCVVDAGAEQGRLADPGLALREQRAAAPVARGADQRVEELELARAAEEAVGLVSMPRTIATNRPPAHALWRCDLRRRVSQAAVVTTCRAWCAGTGGPANHRGVRTIPEVPHALRHRR